MLKKLKIEQKVVAAAILGALALWVVDSLVDAYIFRECAFWESFGGHFTPHELYFRMLFITIFILAGLVVSRLLKRGREHEEKLQQALLAYDDERTKSASVLQAIPDGISIQSRDFRVLYQNDVHKQLMGEHQGEFCYQAYAKSESICPGCPVNESFRDGDLHILEKTRTDHTGTVQIEIRATPLLNAKGEIIAGIEAVRDITERKRLSCHCRTRKSLSTV
jgi:PAS domain-containing protein